MKDEAPNRRTIRLKGFDYSNAGAYFITICTCQRSLIFGQVEAGNVALSPMGRIARSALLQIPDHFEHVRVDEYIVMPNHVHVVLMFRRGTACRAPTREEFGKPVSGSLPTVIRSYKGVVTKRCRERLDNPKFSIWQRGYYDKVIRDERMLQRIRRYIRKNPQQWELDQYFTGS